MAASIPNTPTVHVSGGAQQTSKRWSLWIGRMISALPVIAMGMSGIVKLTHNPQIVQDFTGKFGYNEGALSPIGIVEVICVVFYAIPQTAVLGAVLITGYLGGAVATHLRISDPSFIAPLVLGILAWAGLYLRERRLSDLLPLRRLNKG